MKKRIMLLVMLFIGISSVSFAAYWKSSPDKGGVSHLQAWIMANQIPIKFGGMGKTMNIKSMKILHDIIDEKGKAGKYHRNNGSHNPKLVLKNPKTIALMKTFNIPKKAIFNAVVVHNIVDMATKGKNPENHTGVNGHPYSEEKNAQAKKELDNIMRKKPYKQPKFAKKAPGIFKKAFASIKSFCKNEKVLKIAEKKGVKTGGKVLTKTAEKLPIIISVYEGGKTAYEVGKDVYQGEDLVTTKNTKRVVNSASKISIFFLSAKACTPAELSNGIVPGSGPILHFL